MKKRVLKYGLIAGGLLVLAAVVFLLLFFNRAVTVPQVTGGTLSEATARLEGARFKVQVNTEFSDTTPKDCVISQSVKGGERLKFGSEITLIVSKGPKPVTVPDLQGMTAKEAQRVLQAVGLRLETDIQCSNTVKEGYVISQSVEPGQQISKNSVVRAIISVGVANTVGTTPSNAAQHSRVTAQGDWLYFAVKGGIYKMRKDGTQRQRLCDYGAVSLNVVGEWLYFTHGVTGGIYKIKINGTEETKLSSVTSYMVYVEGDWIYYTSKFSGGQIYKMKTDGSLVTKLTADSCREYIVKDQYIYYINASDSVVYRCGTDGTGKTALCAGFGGTCLTLVGDKLAVEDHYQIKCVNLDGSGYTSFGKTNVQPMLLCGQDGWIYYLELDLRDSNAPMMAFYQVRPDGSEKTKIYDYEYLNHSNAYLNVLDGWLYFQNEHDHDALYRVSLDGVKVQGLN